MKHWKRNMVVASFLLGGFFYWQNNGLVLTRIVYTEKVPYAFDGFKIMQVSDLQNKQFGKHHETLLRKIQAEFPDIIIITGDLLNRNRTDVPVVIEFIKGAVVIAPVYFVSGNHEHQSGQWDVLRENLLDCGVTILDNKKTVIERAGESITLIGLADKRVNPNFVEVLDELTKEVAEDAPIILLSHRPELIDTYAEKGVDLAFTGHAHGGQIRLPLIGGIFAPNQGFFPKYTSGVMELEGTKMVVSRGLGNSSFPFRIFNRPELVEVVLEFDEKNEDRF